MKKLLRLEMKKINIKQNIYIMLMIAGGVFLFMYFFAGISYVKPADVQENALLGSYEFIYSMALLISIVAFSVQAAILFSATVIEEYKNDGLYLLFTYPIKRIQMFSAKIIVTGIVMLGLSLIGMLTAMGLFTGGQTLFPMLSGEAALPVFIGMIAKVIACGILISLIGTLAMLIGFYKKSFPLTVSVAIVLATIICNFLSLVGIFIIPVLCLLVAISVGCLYYLQCRNITKLEVL